MRCGLLHQGQAQPDDSKLKAGEVLRYDRVAFGPSGWPHMDVKGRLLQVVSFAKTPSRDWTMGERCARHREQWPSYSLC